MKPYRIEILKSRLTKLILLLVATALASTYPAPAFATSNLGVCASIGQSIESIHTLLELSSRRNSDYMEIETKINAIAANCEAKSSTGSAAKLELKNLEPRMESFSKIHKILVVQVPFIQSRLIDLGEKKCSKELELFSQELKQAPAQIQELKSRLAKSCGGSI